MCYIHHTYDLLMTGYIGEGDTLEDMTLRLSTDVDFAGEEGAKSTSGVFPMPCGTQYTIPTCRSFQDTTYDSLVDTGS